jgi:hypothetical protein
MVSEKPEQEGHEGNEGHEEKQKLYQRIGRIKTDQNGSFLPAGQLAKQSPRAMRSRWLGTIRSDPFRSGQSVLDCL